MSSTVPSEFDASSLIQRISDGALSRDFVVLAAKGFLPVAQEDLVAVLAFLSTYHDDEVAQLARTSLTEMPQRLVLAFARDEKSNPQLLQSLSISTSESPILEALIRNRSTPDAAVEALAAHANGALLEVVVVNQERLLRRPEILDALLANPSTPPDTRRRALEVREEFFEKKKAIEEATRIEPLTPEEHAVIADLLVEAEAQDQAPPPAPAAPPPDIAAGDPDKESIWVQLSKMSVSQKVQLAFKGSMTVRAMLVRERNKLICTAVARSPRLSESEVESYAGLRSVEDEVLRIIGSNRQWMAKYPIMVALAKNPKSPIGVVLPLINRLTLKDLKSLASDKGVSETVRSSARRLLAQRKP